MSSGQAVSLPFTVCHEKCTGPLCAQSEAWESKAPKSAPTDPVAQYIYPRPLLILKLNSQVWHKGWQHFQILTLALPQMQNLPQLPSWVDSSLRALGHRPGLPQTHSLSLMVLEVLTHPRTTVCTSAPVPSSSYPPTIIKPLFLLS